MAIGRMKDWDSISVTQMFAGEGLAARLRKRQFDEEVKRADVAQKKRDADAEALAKYKYKAGSVGVSRVTRTPDNTPDNTWRGTWLPTPATPFAMAPDTPAQFKSFHEMAVSRPSSTPAPSVTLGKSAPRPTGAGDDVIPESRSQTPHDSCTPSLANTASSDCGRATGAMKQRASEADSAENNRTRASAADPEMLRAKLTKEKAKRAKEEAQLAKEAYQREVRESPWGTPCPRYKCFCHGKTSESREFLKTGILPPTPEFVNVHDHVKAIFALKPSTTILADGCILQIGFEVRAPASTASTANTSATTSTNPTACTSATASTVSTAGTSQVSTPTLMASPAVQKAHASELSPPEAARKRPVVRFNDADLVSTVSCGPQEVCKAEVKLERPPRRARSEGGTKKNPIKNSSGGSRSTSVAKESTSKSGPQITIVPAEHAESAIMTEEEESDPCATFDRTSRKERMERKMHLAAPTRLRPSKTFQPPIKGILKTSPRSVSTETSGTCADEDEVVSKNTIENKGCRAKARALQPPQHIAAASSEASSISADGDEVVSTNTNENKLGRRRGRSRVLQLLQSFAAAN
ncbi:hypothetical protein LTR08_008373 [Meristemomyces frigidus]|nr:hypothetical protein LTR08_008373 [Meristemomyces frigidus]